MHLFGRKVLNVAVQPPDRAGRAAILRVHTHGIPLAADVDLDGLASTTPGMVGADLANLANEPLERQPDATPVQAPPASDAKAPSARPGSHTSSAWMEDIRDQVLQRIEPTVAVRLTPAELATQVMGLVVEIATRRSLLLNEQEQSILAGAIVDDMIGHGPIEPLLRDDTVADILVNGPKMIYVERRGKLELTMSEDEYFAMLERSVGKHQYWNAAVVAHGRSATGACRHSK